MSMELLGSAMIDRFAHLDDPSAPFVREMTARYAVEREVDELLVRKLRRRGEPPYRRMPLAELEGKLRAFLQTQVRGDFTISGLGWLSGGASKIQVAFTLAWRDSQGERVQRFVLRMDPSESLNATSRLREMELIGAVQHAIPVPRVFFIDESGSFFPEPALIYSHVSGVTRPRTTRTGMISGLGTVFEGPLRAQLANGFVSHLAAIHTLDLSAARFRSMDIPRTGSKECALWQLNRARRVWDEDRCADMPLMDIAAAWLEENAPVMDHAGVVHGDYRSGNFLFDEDSGKITAWLDWERGLIGDRHRDLAWTCQRNLGRRQTGGSDVFLVSGLIPEAEFWDAYEEASGLSVDAHRLHYYSVLNCYQRIVAVAGTARRLIRLGKTHQDILLANVQHLVPILSSELIALLRKEL